MAGSILNVNIAGRSFSVASDADVGTKLGGFENEYQSNGDGTGRNIKTKVGWQLEGVAISTDRDNGDLEYLQEIADSPDFVAISITYASGVVRSGTGTITGEIKEPAASGATPINFEGPGTLTKQS
jgi:hypothetical protein